MQAYKTTETHPTQPTKTSWQGSLADAAKARKAAKANGGEATSVPVQIPTDKQGLLQFLNGAEG